MSQTEKSCAIYFKDDAVYVIAHVMTDHGRVAKEPMVKQATETPAEELGQTVLDALAAFEEIDGPPRPDHLEQFLGYVGAKSWRAFAKGTLHILVGFDGKEVKLTPCRGDGRGAFLFDNDPSICPPDPGRLGSRILELAEAF